MARGEIHAELRAMRPWVLTMGILALTFLTCWLLLAVVLLVAPGIQGNSPDMQRLDGVIRLFAALLLVFSLGGLLPFANLLRLGLRLGELRTEDPGSLLRAMEAQRVFWRQAEWLMWAVAGLMAFAIIGFACL